jgi:hypothetical protein
MKRRTLLKSILVLPFAGTLLSELNLRSFPAIEMSRNENFGGLSGYDTCTFNKFSELIQVAKKNDWNQFPINDLISKFAYELIGTPYISNTLDCSGNEIVKLNLCGVDCVTYFESMLCLARILKKVGVNGLSPIQKNERPSIEDFLDEIRFTRYRGGNLTDYTSRLHYTADWIYDNVQKHVVEDISKELGGDKIKFNLNFMSQNPKYYDALKNDSSLIAKIKEQENNINSRTYYLIPKEKIHLSEPKINTGDIIAIGTNKSGLDYGHTGLAYRTDDSSLHFLHASTKKKMVTLDLKISEFVNANKSFTGISVLRPLEIKQ